MRNYYILILLLFPFQTFSQNYRTVIPGKENFFENATGYIKGIRAGAIQSLGSDSVSYQFYSILDTSYNSNSCIIDSGPSWIGYSVLFRPDGFNVFTNLYGDSIFINTQSSLNDSWKLYTYKSGYYIQATMTDISYESVGQQGMDSIKTIELQIKNSLGNDVIGYYNFMQLRISRTNGFVKLFPFVNFPEDTVNYNWVDMHRPTIGEIYDFNVGDTIQTSLQSSYALTTYITTLKHFSTNNDTVFYTQLIKSNDVVQDFPGYHRVYKDTTESFFVTDLNTPFYVTMPEETMYKDTYEASYYQMSENYYCGSLYMQEIWGDYALIGNNCLQRAFEPIYEGWGYAVGLGQVYYLYDASSQGGPGAGYDISLIYYSKNNGSKRCGNLILSANEITTSKNSFSVFPNPSAGTFHISLNTVNEISKDVFIYDTFGRQIYENIAIKGADLDIDLSKNAKGVYFVKVIGQGASSVKKIMII